jgi:hypothetical protein
MSIEAASSDASFGSAAGRPPTPAALARDVTQAYLDQQWDRMELLIHPEARLETGFSVPGASFGKQAALDAGWVARSTDAFRPEYQLAESLDADTALVAVRIRYQVGDDLFSERDAAYLMTFDDGLLRETLVFDSVDAALAAHRARTAAAS